MRRLLLLLLLAAAPLSARAQDAPRLLPDRDADILYRLLPGSPASAPVLTERLRWRQSAQEERLDPPAAVAAASGAGTYLLIDFAVGQMLVVQPATRTLYLLPAPPNALPGGSGRAFRRTGADQVAGLPCTVWTGRDDSGHEADICVTEDGLMLRTREGGTVLAQAISVSLAPQDPSVFVAPAGYALQRPGPPAAPSGAAPAPSQAAR